MFNEITVGLQTIRSALSCKKGVTAIEYGLIAAGISLVVAGATPVIRPLLTTVFANIGTGLQ